MLLLGLTAALAYFIESVFGFGGTVLLLTFGALQLDFKTLVYVSMWAASLASICVLFTGHRDFSARHLARIILISLPGLLLGTWLLAYAPGPILLTIFAAIMAAYALQGLLAPAWQPPRWLGNGFVAAGGLVQGLYTTGGPFVVAGYRTRFTNKSQLRATMAGFFLLTNVMRALQMTLTGDSGPFDLLVDYWPVLLGVPVAVWLGHHVHLKLSENQFRIGLLLIILLASLFHLARSL